MRKAIWLTALGLAATLLASLASRELVEAKTKLVPLEDYVKNTGAILAGRIVAIEESSELSPTSTPDVRRHLKTATVQVEEPLSTHLSAGATLQLYYDPYSSVEQKYATGRKYLMFLSMSQNRWRSYHGYAGSIEIRQDGKLDFVYMANEPEEQEAADFVRKVRLLLGEEKR